MLRVIALAAAIAVSASIASAQGSGTVAKSTAKTTTATVKRHGATAKSQSQSSLRKEAKISEKTARATALKEVPNGKIKSSELERENGNLIYSFDIVVAGKSGVEEVNVNAIDGSIVAHEHETAKSEKKEAAQESKTKK
jgi:uncharacterized membrane protein YkoI